MAKMKMRSTRKVTAPYTHEAMASAMAEVRAGKSVREAAYRYKVPKSSLYDRITGKVQHGAIWGKQPVLNKEDEELLIKTAEHRAEQGVGFTKRALMKYANILATKKGRAFKKNMPSKMWWRRLKSRNSSFSLRLQEATSTARHQAMSRIRIAKYFSALKTIMEKSGTMNKPSKIWNMDETGINMTHKPGKVIAKRGSKAVHGKASASREMVTVIACGNAEGQVIPAHIIVPGKTEKKLHGYDLESVDRKSPLKGAIFSVSDSGWTKDGIAKLWFTQTFLRNIGPERPQILICDGHTSHNNIEFITLAREENIHIVELPSHTSNWTQPFDRTVFKSLKSAWNNEVDEFTHNTGITVGHGQFLRVFGKAWASALTPSNVKSGFRATGIYPFNPSVIPEEAYKPSELYSDQSPSNVASETSVVEATSSSNAASVALPGMSVEDETVASENPASAISNEISIETPAAETLVADVSFSIPLQYDEPLEPYLNLPVVVKENGSIILEDCHVQEASTSAPDAQERSESAATVNVTECPDGKALEIIESILSPQEILSYTAALVSGKDIKNDSLFQTWKMYKSKTLGANQTMETTCTEEDIFPKLQLRAPKRQVKPKKGQNYFVITSDEAYEQKLEAAAEKERKLQEKMKKQIDRENKQKLLNEKKLLLQQIKAERIKRKMVKQQKRLPSQQ